MTSSRALIFSSIIVMFLAFPARTQDTQNSITKQQIRSKVPSFFTQTLEYSRSSITFFLKNIFNNSAYAQEYLACNLSHISQGLSVAQHHPQPRRFMKKILNLFSLKLHTIYINPYAWSSFLDDLIHYGAAHTCIDKEREYLVSSFKQTIGECLVNNFDQLRHEPDRTLDELATTLYNLLNQPDQDSSVRELQHVIHYFLTQGIKLLTWSPVDQEDVWYSMLTIADQLEDLVNYHLIDIEMLDDLYWALLYRFSIFLAAAGPELDTSFFNVARTSLRSDSPLLWLLEERELYITSKFDYLKTMLLETEVTSQLQAMGHIIR